MKGSVVRLCWCRDPLTKKKMHSGCPKLQQRNHGRWYIRFDAPRAPGEARRQPLTGPFRTRREAEEELAATLARIGGGGPAPDRSQKVATFLRAHAEGKIDVKPRTQESIHEAIELYWIPTLGHLRLVDLRAHHIADAVQEMLRINRPDESGRRQSETLRRLLAARAPDERRVLAPGEARRKKSTKPLSPARIRRVYAVLHGALATAVPSKIAVNPCDGVILPRVPKVRPLPWSADREAAFRRQLGRKLAAEAGARELTTVDKQRLWADAGLRPCPVMVWLPEHTGRFLDYLEETSDRLSALFCVVAYCGLRRGEVLGLHWADLDLGVGVMSVRETNTGDGPKSAAGVRAVPLAAPVVAALRAWHKAQSAEQLAWGADWPETGLVFTREDGTPIPGQWASTRFETLAWRAELPPIRFHDLRHGAASLAKAAGLDSKYISAMLGHSRTSFTDSTYVLLFPDVARAAAESAAAVVPRGSDRGTG